MKASILVFPLFALLLSFTTNQQLLVSDSSCGDWLKTSFSEIEIQYCRVINPDQNDQFHFQNVSQDNLGVSFKVNGSSRYVTIDAGEESGLTNMADGDEGNIEVTNVEILE